MPLSAAAQHVESHPALTDVVFGDFVHCWRPISPPGSLACITPHVQRAYMHKRSAQNPNPLRRCRGKLSSLPSLLSPLSSPLSPLPTHRRLHHQPHSSHWIDIPKMPTCVSHFPALLVPHPQMSKTSPAH